MPWTPGACRLAAPTIDGHQVLGDGLTVWVHRGGQLAALTQSETTAASAPLERVGPEAAMTAVRDWAQRGPACRTRA